MFYQTKYAIKYLLMILLVISTSCLHTPLNYAENSEYIKVLGENDDYHYGYKISDTSIIYAIGNAIFLDFFYGTFSFDLDPSENLSFKITYGEGLQYNKIEPIMSDRSDYPKEIIRLDDPILTEHDIYYTSPNVDGQNYHTMGSYLFEIINSTDCYINVEVSVGNNIVHQKSYIFLVDNSMITGKYKVNNEDCVFESYYTIYKKKDSLKNLSDAIEEINNESFAPGYRVTINKDTSGQENINDFIGTLDELFEINERRASFKIGEINLSSLEYPCTITIEPINLHFPYKMDTDYHDVIESSYAIPGIFNRIENSNPKLESDGSEHITQLSQDAMKVQTDVAPNNESKTKTLWIISVILLSGAGISVRMGLFSIAKAIINDYNILRIKKDTDSKKITPIGYWKLRKFTLFFCENEEESILIKKDTVYFATDRTIELELEPFFGRLEYPVVFVRYPLKAMRHKTDVHIKYYYYSKLISSDTFEDETAFVNVKRIERKNQIIDL